MAAVKKTQVKTFNPLSPYRKLPGTGPYSGVTNVTLLKEAVHFSNRAKVTLIAARGNEGVDDIMYPAVIDDDWVLSVGGSGLNGDYKEASGNGDAASSPWAPNIAFLLTQKASRHTFFQCPYQ